MAPSALVHEFGHRVWFKCLSPEQQDEWTKSWNEAKRRPAPRWTECSGTITGYACTNDLEDFAEVFQAVVLGRVDDYNWKRWVAVCGCGEGILRATHEAHGAAVGRAAHAWRHARRHDSLEDDSGRRRRDQQNAGRWSVRQERGQPLYHLGEPLPAARGPFLLVSLQRCGLRHPERRP